MINEQVENNKKAVETSDYKPFDTKKYEQGTPVITRNNKHYTQNGNQDYYIWNEHLSEWQEIGLENYNRGINEPDIHVNIPEIIPFDVKKFDPGTPLIFKNGKRYTTDGGQHYVWDEGRAEWTKVTDEDYNIAMKEKDVIFEETKVISSGAREATQEEIDQINKIRAKLSRRKRKSNVAYTEGTIDGKEVRMESVSGKEHVKGTVSHKPHEEQQLETSPTKRDKENDQGNPDRRAYDSEVKMLEQILDNTTASSSGKIKLVSELDMCGSCIKAINQFRELRPGIEVELVFTKPYFNPL